MVNSYPTPSQARDLVAQIIQDNPDIAVALVRLFVLLDASTPLGAAMRTDAMKYAYSFTEDCREAMERFIVAA